MLVQKVPGIVFDASAPGPRYEISDEDRVLGQGGLAILTDPEFIDESGSLIMNRAGPRGDDFFNPRTFVIDEFANEAPCFLLTADNFVRVTPLQTSINPNAWTYTVAFLPTLGASPPRHVTPIGTAPGIPFFIGTTNTGNTLNVYEEATQATGNATRLSYFGGFANFSDPAIISVTFSTERGLALFVDGVAVDAAPLDVRPLEVGIEPGSFEMFPFCRGRFGQAAIWNSDLRAAPRTFDRMLGYFASKYKSVV